MKGAWLVWGALSAALAAQEVSLPSEVVFGAPFEVVVTGSSPFDPSTLSPLEVEIVERTALGDRERVRLRARCYELGERTLSLSPPRTLRVVTALPTPPGDLEWPSDGYEVSADRALRWWVAGLTALAIIGVYAGWRWLVRRGAIAPAGALATTWSAAAAIDALPQSSGVDAAWFGLLKSILRRHCRERFGVNADVRTSEELLSVTPHAQGDLSVCLQGIDMALFSQLAPPSDGAARARERALAFVRATEAAS